MLSTFDKIKARWAASKAMRDNGAVALRTLTDHEGRTLLIFWATPSGLAITQWSRESGEVLYLRDVDDAQMACGPVEARIKGSIK